jgi:hypothetical protein
MHVYQMYYFTKCEVGVRLAYIWCFFLFRNTLYKLLQSIYKLMYVYCVNVSVSFITIRTTTWIFQIKVGCLACMSPIACLFCLWTNIYFRYDMTKHDRIISIQLSNTKSLVLYLPSFWDMSLFDHLLIGFIKRKSCSCQNVMFVSQCLSDFV